MSKVSKRKRRSNKLRFLLFLFMFFLVVFGFTQRNKIIVSFSSLSVFKSQESRQKEDIFDPNANTSFHSENSVDNRQKSTTLDDSSYLMINCGTHERILTKNASIPRPPASTMKLLTGLVVMERLSEEDIIQVGNEVKDIKGSVIGLQPGDKIRVEELLKAMYIKSANDAASALAVAAYGSTEEFIERMNEFAREIGCMNSQFKTPHGLPAEGQYTTAVDMTKIALSFIKNETLMKYVVIDEAKVNWTRSNGLKLSIPVKNTNELLTIYPGDHGLKTGTTTEAGQCLVTYIKNADGEFILTLLGSDKRYNETIDLLDQGLSMIRTREALGNIVTHPNAVTSAPGYYVP